MGRTAEAVPKGHLHGNACFYIENPVECPNALPHYVGASPEIPDEEEVFILYSSEDMRRSYFRRELQGRRYYDQQAGSKTGMAAIGEAVGFPYYDGHGGFTS